MLLAISPAHSSSQCSSTEGAPPRPATSTAPSRREPCCRAGVHASGAASSQSQPLSVRSWRQSASSSLRQGGLRQAGVPACGAQLVPAGRAVAPHGHLSRAAKAHARCLHAPLQPCQVPELACIPTHRSGVEASTRTIACRCRQRCTALGCSRAKNGVGTRGAVLTLPSLISS